MVSAKQASSSASYYANKLDELKDLFGARLVSLEGGFLVVDGRHYRIEDDVIIVSEGSDEVTKASSQGNRTINSFSNEWESYPKILPEHRAEFETYFDIVDRNLLQDARCLDLGCGIGRWSYHVHEKTERLVLVDASRAIFIARRNLRHADKAIFVRADLRELPFRKDAFDFLFCLGVLHHLEENCLDLTRMLAPFAERLLVYLYYALDNRPWHYGALLVLVDFVRRCFIRIKSESLRTGLSRFMAWTVYRPLILLGGFMNLFGLGKHVPLYDGYKNSTTTRLAQDVYDRFFTPIEQRVSKAQIMTLSDTFSSIEFSSNLPFWHFLLSGKTGSNEASARRCPRAPNPAGI